MGTNFIGWRCPLAMYFLNSLTSEWASCLWEMGPKKPTPYGNVNFKKCFYHKSDNSFGFLSKKYVKKLFFFFQNSDWKWVKNA